MNGKEMKEVRDYMFYFPGYKYRFTQEAILYLFQLVFKEETEEFLIFWTFLTNG